jgi:SpoVK/Ycf46/Vps4 family AAA+-type ATPase
MQMSPYTWDAGITERLVLPEQVLGVVDTLVHADGKWKDIVRGKSGGMVVLLSGPPGVGKTLTAEVYSEHARRPLYSVQCSQLGTDPEHLEEALIWSFKRCSRWNAVLLLDEADVYIKARGDDLIQNAIVGVFLRILEYQSAIVFLTTNRPNTVDDAILSRCVASITYAKPTLEGLVRIWQNLIAVAGVQLAPSTNAQELAAMAHAEGWSGRDVKNTLKLAYIMGRGAPITKEHVTEARQFKT